MINLISIKNISKYLIFAFMIGILSFYSIAKASSTMIYDTFDLKLSRQWQGLNNQTWANWHIKYKLSLSDSHDTLYKKTQQSNNGSYFKSGEITNRPLIIWFAYKDSRISQPAVIYTSGSAKYDNFNIEVIKKTSVPSFPEDKDRIFMWDGELKDLVRFLKSKGVFPYNYSLQNNIDASMINWEKI